MSAAVDHTAAIARAFRTLNSLLGNPAGFVHRPGPEDLRRLIDNAISRRNQINTTVAAALRTLADAEGFSTWDR